MPAGNASESGDEELVVYDLAPDCTVDDVEVSARPVRRVYEAWERSGGRHGRRGSDDMAAIHPELLVFSPRGKSGRLHFVEVGRKAALARFLGRGWAKAVLGKPYDRGQSDLEYENRVTSGYAEVMRTGEPRLDQIRGIIRPDDGDPVWVAYQRLLIRSYEADGSPCLACYSYPTQDLSIPFPAALPGR